MGNARMSVYRKRALRAEEDLIFASMGNVYKLMIDEGKRRAAEEAYLLELADEARRVGGARQSGGARRSGAERESDAAHRRPRATTRVLDLGCGTGFHARLLARAGYPVVGVDLSPSMLAEARRTSSRGDSRNGSRGRLRGGDIVYQLGDLLDPIAIARPASLTLLLGNTLSVFETREKLRAALRNAAAATRPGGIVVCQILNYARVLCLPPAAITRHGRVGGHETVLTKSLQPLDDGAVLLTFTASQPGENGEWRTRAESARLRAWRPKEIVETARAAGLELQAKWGSMGKDSFDPRRSGDSVLQFRKK